MKKSADELFRESQAIEGKKGGDLTLHKYGTTHFVKAANIRWEKERAKKKLSTKNKLK